jgi:hypothetical protein
MERSVDILWPARKKRFPADRARQMIESAGLRISPVEYAGSYHHPIIAGPQRFFADGSAGFSRMKMSFWIMCSRLETGVSG